MVVDYRFFDSPEWKALDKAGKLLLLYFAVKADRKNGFSCNPSLRQISEQTGYGERTLLETLSHLVKTGLIRRKKSARWFDHERTVTVISYPQKIQVASDDLPAENTGRLPAKNAGIYPQKLPDRKGIKETKEILSFLNTGCGTAFKPTTRETARLISGRLMEGYTVEDFKAVISSKAKEWKSRDEMRQFLCPATLFRPSNFEKYLQAAQTAAKSRPPEPAAYKPFPSMAAA